MEAVHIVTGTAVPLDRSDVDTDQIIPSDWLKRVERTGFEKGLFSEWRDDRDFVLNQERVRRAPRILVGRAQLRHRLVPRARGVGHPAVRLPGGGLAPLRRHLPQQLHQERPGAGRGVAPRSASSCCAPSRPTRRSRSRSTSSAAPSRPRRSASSVEFPLDDVGAAPLPRGPRRHRPHPPEGQRHRRLRGHPPGLAPHDRLDPAYHPRMLRPRRASGDGLPVSRLHSAASPHTDPVLVGSPRLPARRLRKVFLLGVLVGLAVALVRALTRLDRAAVRRAAGHADRPVALAPPRPSRHRPRRPRPASRARAPNPSPSRRPNGSSSATRSWPSRSPTRSRTPPTTASGSCGATRSSPSSRPRPHDIEPAPPHSIETTWVAPIDGGCPPGYPIKAKTGSQIFHQPGGLSYERTRPDRCYPSPEAAEADGFRAAKR